MDATKTEDAPNDSSFAEMDPERRRFLEEALKSLTVNVVEQLEGAVRTITDETSSEEDTLDALEVISDYIQDIDAANDFFKVGGFCILNPCLASKHVSVRSAALRVIRDLAQNNPFCQEKLLDHGILNKLVESVSDTSDLVSCDGMGAISALVRAYETGLKAFIEVGGLECMLASIVDESRIKLQIRVAFLIPTITAEVPCLVDQFVQLNGVARIATFIRVLGKEEEEDDPNKVMRLEKCLLALASLTATAEGVKRCRSAGLGGRLEEIVRSVSGKEEFQEIHECALEILGRIGGSNKENADR